MWLILIRLLVLLTLGLPHYTAGKVDVPEFTEEPTSQYVKLGTPVTLECGVRPASTQVWWLLGGRRIRTDPQRGYRIENGRLFIDSFQKRGGLSHVGVYQCVANNSYGAIISQQAILDKASLRQFEDEENTEDIHVNATEGNVALIPCLPPRGQPEVLTRFTVNGTDIDHANKRRHYYLLPSGSMQIGNVRPSDQGVYRCVAYNPVSGQERPAPAAIHLHVLLPVTNSLTRFVQKPEEQVKAQEGSNVTLECVTEGSPVPVVVWNKFGGELPQNRYSNILGNLVIHNVQMLDTGTYICQANNEMSPQTAITKLTVLGIPMVRVVPASSEVREGETIRLRCRVPPRISVHVEWWHNAQLLSEDDDSIVIDDTEVTVRHAQLQHAGIYQCVANTRFSSASAATWIDVTPRVEENPDAEETEDEISVKPTDGSEENNQPNDNHNIRPPTPGYTGFGRQVLVPPSKPTVEKLSDHSVMLSWSVSDNVGLNITFFKVQYKAKQSDNQRWVTLEEVIPKDARRYEVSNLIPGGTYRFRVVAVYSNNDNQQGPNSDRFTLEIGKKYDPEAAPVDRPFLVKVEAVSSSRLELEWQYDNDSPIEGFVLKYRPYYSPPGDVQEYYLPDARARKFRLGSLQPDTEYTVSIYSFNAAGEGPSSNPAVRRTKVDDSDSTGRVITVPGSWVPPIEGGSKEGVGKDGNNSPSTSYPATSTESSSQMLYLVLGIVLGVMMLLLVIFMVMCGWRQRQHRRMMAAIDNRNKFHDPSRAVYADSLRKKQMNGGMFLLNGVNGGPNGAIPNGHANGFSPGNQNDKVNISVNPMTELEMKGLTPNGETQHEQSPNGSASNMFHAPPPPPVCCCSEDCNGTVLHQEHCSSQHHVCDSNVSSRENLSQSEHCCCHSPRDSCCESQTYCPPEYNSFSTFNKGCQGNELPNGGGQGPGPYYQQQGPVGRTFSPDHIPRSFERPYRSHPPHSGSSDGLPSGSHEPYDHLSEHSHSNSSCSHASGRPPRQRQRHSSSGKDTPTKNQATNTDISSNEGTLDTEQQSLPYSPCEDRSPDDLPPPPFIPPPHPIYHQYSHAPHTPPQHSLPLLPRANDYSPSDNELDETESFLG